MNDELRHNQLPPPDGSEDRPDGFVSLAILAFVVVAPLIYFGPELGAIEAWFVDVYRMIDGWVAPIRSSWSLANMLGEHPIRPHVQGFSRIA